LAFFFSLSYIATRNKI